MGARLSLDYIFEVYFDEDIDMKNKKSFQIGDYVKIEKFLVKDIEHLEEDNRVYTQLSDHYGLSFCVFFKGNKFFN